VAGTGGATGAGGTAVASTGGLTGTGGSGAGGAGGAPGGGSGGMAGATMTGAGGATGGSTGAELFTVMVQLASDIQPTAPSTVGIVTWSISVPGITSAHIDFGLDTTYGMTAPVDLTAAGYRTLLLGMKTTRTYHFQIVATDGAKTYASGDQTVTTGAATGLTGKPVSSFSVMAPSAVPKGFFITSFWTIPISGTPPADLAFIFDTDGDLVWWYSDGVGKTPQGIARARMSADSQSLWMVSPLNLPLWRVTMDGLTVQTYSNTKASHDVAAVTGDTMAYLDESESDCESIFEIDNTGTTKEIFEPTGTLDPSSVTRGDGADNCHANAVRYSKKQDVYTYSDWQRELAVISRSGAILWKLTDKVSGGNAAWGGAQHGNQLLDSSILLFANRYVSSTQSAAVEYGLDGQLIKAFSSRGTAQNLGDVQRLSNGNTIITYSGSGLIQEVDANDDVLLEAKCLGYNASAILGYLEFRDNLYGPPLDINQ